MCSLGPASNIKNNYLLLLGIAYGFIGILDLFHTLAYKGMPIFTDYDYYANQLWIAARYFESAVTLLAVLSIRMKKQINIYVLVVGYTILTAGFMLSIFVWKNFPICYVEGSGLTSFKIISEYVICIILIISLLALKKYKENFKDNLYRIFSLSIIFTILSELAFTLYIDNYDLSNLVGHYFKILSFFLIYKVIIKTGIQEPYDIIFREMQLTQKKLSDQNEILMNLSTLDGLTGLYNHRTIYERLEAELKRARRTNHDLAVTMLDIDHFKEINDTYGHIVGDTILRQLADILKKQLRQSDIIGRFGGEEFIVIFVDTNLEMAVKVTEKIRIIVERFIFDQDIRVTISCGVAKYAGEGINELINRADEKMYEAKRDGRNRTKR